MTDGLLLIDKPTACTSHDVVQAVRRILRQKRVGHCGTLDPTATGLLLITVGRATRLTRFLIKAPKVYEGTIRFGAETDSFDAAGEIVNESPTDELTLEAIGDGMRGFVGTYEHLTPAYSAKKHKGVKFYQMARRGEEVPESRKEISVFAFDPVGELEADEVNFELSCSSGTYVRSLAHELGLGLGCGAFLAGLRRTRIGPFRVEDAVDLDALAEAQGGEGQPAGAWVPFDEITLPFSEVVADASQERRIRHGQSILVREGDPAEGDWIKVVSRRREFVAVGTVVERIGGEGGVVVVQPRIVFTS